MAKNNTVYQQRQWILEDYRSIMEDPQSYGYPNLEEHMDEVIADIKEDAEQVFCCNISESFNQISNTIRTWKIEIHSEVLE